jgi:uncharacterized protein YodC (DUF2158 family)
MLQTPKYFVGDVVCLHNMFGEAVAKTAMTVCGFDGEGRVKCVWFNSYGVLKHGAFWERNIVPLNLTINVPPNVLSAVQRWNSTSNL